MTWLCYWLPIPEPDRKPEHWNYQPRLRRMNDRRKASRDGPGRRANSRKSLCSASARSREAERISTYIRIRKRSVLDRSRCQSNRHFHKRTSQKGIMQALPWITHGKNLCKIRHQFILMGRNYANHVLHNSFTLSSCIL